MIKPAKIYAQALCSGLREGRFGLRGLSLLDQLFFSAANFILMLTLARYYPSTDVAGYGIGLSIALILQSVQRTLYVVQNAILPAPVFRRRSAAVMGEHLLLWGAVISAGLLISVTVFLLFPSAYVAAILEAGIACCLIYTQLDFDRMCLLKHEKYKDPLIASVIFFTVNALIFLLAPYKTLPFGTLMSLIGLYAIFKTIRLVFLTGRPDFITGRRLLQRDMRKHLTASALGVAGFSGFSHIPLFILGTVAAPIHAAAFVAVRALVQPLGIVLRSLDVIDKNIFAASGAGSPDSLKTMLRKQLFLYGLFAAGACVGILLFGQPVMGWLYAHLYDDFYGVLLGWAAIFAMMALTFPLETVIVKQGQLTLYNLWRLGAGATGIALSMILIPPLGANGAIAACLGGWLISVLSAFLLVRGTFSDRTKPSRKQA
ncbi:MAG: hypothetical protein KDJ75_03730 [Alphaproteobacteria bacterium]|nr:hypothetical protein [Alphaproteobacteria bacterium]